jgi:hypothetical protein
MESNAYFVTDSVSNVTKTQVTKKSLSISGVQFCE